MKQSLLPLKNQVSPVRRQQRNQSIAHAARITKPGPNQAPSVGGCREEQPSHIPFRRDGSHCLEGDCSGLRKTTSEGRKAVREEGGEKRVPGPRRPQPHAGLCYAVSSRHVAIATPSASSSAPTPLPSP